jgi:excisionase family DNA binding protein
MKKDQSINQELVVIGEAAEFLNVSVDTVRRYDKLGILHSTRPGGKIRYFDLQELKKVKSSKPFNMAAAARPSEVKVSVFKAARLKKVSLLLVKVLIILLTILTVLFLLFPEQTAHLLTSFM